jgi:HNH endonuclease
MEEKDKVDLIPCGCGCGQLTPRFDKRGRPRKYIQYHHTEGRFFLGFKHKDESKKKMSLHRSGANHGMWKGGRYLAAKGYYYRYKPDHHFASKDGYVMEHRLVWENTNNAILLPWADVHHVDGNHINNRIRNLQAMMHGQHTILTNTKDLSDRTCSMCESNTTYSKKNKPIWYKDGKDGFLCGRCYKVRGRSP